MTHATIRMVERADGSDYRRVPEREFRAMFDRDLLRFEGVDGDEVANTVTYWYLRVARHPEED